MLKAKSFSSISLVYRTISEYEAWIADNPYIDIINISIMGKDRDKIVLTYSETEMLRPSKRNLTLGDD